MSSVCCREYEAIYLKTSSLNPRKDGFLGENGSPIPTANSSLSASKLMERKIMFFTSCWERVGSFAACRHFVGEVGTVESQNEAEAQLNGHPHPGPGSAGGLAGECVGTALAGPVSLVQGRD